MHISYKHIACAIMSLSGRREEGSISSCQSCRSGKHYKLFWTPSPPWLEIYRTGFFISGYLSVDLCVSVDLQCLPCKSIKPTFNRIAFSSTLWILGICGVTSWTGFTAGLAFLVLVRPSIAFGAFPAFLVVESPFWTCHCEPKLFHCFIPGFLRVINLERKGR